MKANATEEKRRHSSALVPFSYYKCRMPEYFSSVPLHWHAELEMNVVRDGFIDCIIGDDKLTAAKGDIVIVAPNVLHAIYPHGDGGQSYDTIVFSSDMLGASDNDRSAAECIRPLANGGFTALHITPSHTYYNELKTTADNVISCAIGNTAQLDMLMKSELLRLFWLLENSGDIDRAPAAGSRNEVIRAALEYIAENYSESITVEQLAETVHLSKSYFMSRFRQAAGVSAVEYVTQYRIRAACAALIDTSESVSEISFECGFRNLSNFNRQFKRLMGCTPNEYRKLGERHDYR
ncbi:MAG: AraC family transcriptional regulator [Oscillospiraceae bacterium]|nr:AraC family transcriptional regulator [Oscillospiraceae bacterium]